MKNEIELIPSYWANVSGGKDSLFMLKLILSNLDRYPLDGVVHFELDIDYPFIHDVIAYMERECSKYNIPFYRISPRKTWEELYYTKFATGSIHGFPTRTARWCNSEYKLDSYSQLSAIMAASGRSVVSYIGYCYDEEKRYNKRTKKQEIYPLVENGIYEDTILQWAKHIDLFNNYYISNKRCGCMYCPLSSMITYAYLYKYYPRHFDYMIDKMRETEHLRSIELGRSFSVISSKPKYNADYLEHIIKTKWIYKLNQVENEYKESECFIYG